MHFNFVISLIRMSEFVRQSNTALTLKESGKTRSKLQNLFLLVKFDQLNLGILAQVGDYWRRGRLRLVVVREVYGVEKLCQTGAWHRSAIRGICCHVRLGERLRERAQEGEPKGD